MDYLKGKSINIHLCPNLSTWAHKHKFLELAYVTVGEAVHRINGINPTIIRQGDYFIIDYETEHEYVSEGEEFCVINCLFLPELLDKSLVYCRDFHTLLRHYLIKINAEMMNFGPANHIFHDDDGKIRDILEEMLDEYNNENSSWQEFVRSDLIKLFILTARKIPMSSKEESITQKIINEITHNFGMRLMLSDIIDGMNYSLPYISKKFKSETGMSFQEYLKKTRINEACRLLANSSKKIEEISVLSGYGDTDCFRKAFKEITNMTPKEFRQHIYG